MTNSLCLWLACLDYLVKSFAIVLYANLFTRALHLLRIALASIDTLVIMMKQYIYSIVVVLMLTALVTTILWSCDL